MTARLLSTLALITLLGSCKGEGPITGSETHFLSYCSSEMPCGEGLECVCGVCSDSCSVEDDCAVLAPEAACVFPGARPADHACGLQGTSGSCEVSCSEDGDCQALSGEHRCDRGYCRRLAVDCDGGGTAPSEVVLLGDLFWAETGALTASLEELARSSGALSPGETYRDYSSTLTDPFGEAADVVSQYQSARDDGTIRTVILNAGGPDALETCPEPPTLDCASLANAVTGTEALLSQMAADGVEHVVLFFYPDPEDQALAAKFDVLRPELETACDSSSVACHFVDLRPTFAGHEADYLKDGGVLPTEAGSAATASVLWSVLEQNCIAQ